MSFTYRSQGVHFSIEKWQKKTPPKRGPILGCPLGAGFCCYFFDVARNDGALPCGNSSSLGGSVSSLSRNSPQAGVSDCTGGRIGATATVCGALGPPPAGTAIPPCAWVIMGNAVGGYRQHAPADPSIPPAYRKWAQSKQVSTSCDVTFWHSRFWRRLWRCLKRRFYPCRRCLLASAMPP